MNKNNFDALRLLSALLVLISHQFALSGRWEPRLIGDHSFGNIGVLCFFAMSGYLVTISWKNDPNPLRFLIRRFLRMAPGLLVAISLSYSIIYLLLGSVDFPRNPLSAFNGSLWTISLEVYCYLLLLALGILFSNPTIPLLSIIFIWWWMSGGQTTTNYLTYFGLFFGAGALISQYQVLTKFKMIIIFTITGLALLLINQTMLALTFTIPIYIINIGARSWFIARDLIRQGDFSYGIYIYAWPTQQLFIHWLGKESNYFTLLIPSLLTTILLAYLSWNFIEKPMLRLKPLNLLRPTSPSLT